MMLPEKFTERMKQMLGEDATDFFQSLEQEKYQALRMNPLKRRYVAEDTEGGSDAMLHGPGVFFKLTQVSWESNGYYYSAGDQPGKHPLHEAGVYYIQEPSAMAVVPLLEVKPGEKVLDLCAAPGGKSTQIAGYLRGEGLLVANEIHPARAKILSENIERMGVRNALVTNEEPTRLSEKFPGYFDRILVDAPCSGEGMFRKNEAACGEWSEENVRLCADRQGQILDRAAQMLRPGGRIVYSTCTFAPAENEGSVWRFLQRHPDFELLPIDKAAMGLPQGKCDGRPEWCDMTVAGSAAAGEAGAEYSAELCRALRLWPHLVKGEGHFAAVLQHKGIWADGADGAYESMASGGLEKGISPKDKSLEPWWDFWKSIQTEGKGEELSMRKYLEQGIFLRFGDNLYLAPQNMPSLKGMKVLRPGLQLGTMKKDRFEPAHALALAISPDEIRHICQLPIRAESNRGAGDGNASMYLSGQTFPVEGEKGWYLITADGYGLGWGKAAGAS